MQYSYLTIALNIINIKRKKTPPKNKGNYNRQCFSFKSFIFDITKQPQKPVLFFKQ